MAHSNTEVMKMSKIYGKSSLGLIAMAMALGTIGCYSDIRDYCEQQTKCEGGNDNDEDACVEQMKGEKKAAKEYGCRKEYNDYMECAAENNSCEEEFFMEDEKCFSKEEKLWECVEKESELY
jgi:hypothetical protein